MCGAINLLRPWHPCIAAASSSGGTVTALVDSCDQPTVSGRRHRQQAPLDFSRRRSRGGTPLVKDGLLYVGDLGGTIHCLDAATSAHRGKGWIAKAVMGTNLRVACPAEALLRRGCPPTREALRRGSLRLKRERRLVRKGGLEPPRSCDRQPLKLVRLPIPPLSRGCDGPPGSVSFRPATCD